LVVGIPIFLLFFVADTLGTCRPVDNCRTGFLPWVLAPSTVIALLVFFAMRLLVGWLQRCNRRH
jgi:hypothetical protein